MGRGLKHKINKNRPRYRSSFERNIAGDLRRRGVKFKYEPYKIVYWKKIRQAKCIECGCKDIVERHTYLPDFLLNKNNILIEAKGKFTSPMRSKMLAVKESNPELDIRFLFMRNNWLTKKHLERYSDWCEKHSFDYAFMKVPDEWIKKCEK